MSTLFNFTRPPFDRLDEEARERLSRHLSLCYFRAGDLLLKEGKQTDKESCQHELYE